MEAEIRNSKIKVPTKASTQISSALATLYKKHGKNVTVDAVNGVLEKNLGTLYTIEEKTWEKVKTVVGKRRLPPDKAHSAVSQVLSLVSGQFAKSWPAVRGWTLGEIPNGAGGKEFMKLLQDFGMKHLKTGDPVHCEITSKLPTFIDYDAALRAWCLVKDYISLEEKLAKTVDVSHLEDVTRETGPYVAMLFDTIRASGTYAALCKIAEGKDCYFASEHFCVDTPYSYITFVASTTWDDVAHCLPNFYEVDGLMLHHLTRTMYGVLQPPLKEIVFTMLKVLYNCFTEFRLNDTWSAQLLATCGLDLEESELNEVIDMNVPYTLHNLLRTLIDVVVEKSKLERSRVSNFACMQQLVGIDNEEDCNELIGFVESAGVKPFDMCRFRDYLVIRKLSQSIPVMCLKLRISLQPNMTPYECYERIIEIFPSLVQESNKERSAFITSLWNVAEIEGNRVEHNIVKLCNDVEGLLVAFENAEDKHDSRKILKHLVCEELVSCDITAVLLPVLCKWLNIETMETAGHYMCMWSQCCTLQRLHDAAASNSLCDPMLIRMLRRKPQQSYQNLADILYMSPQRKMMENANTVAVAVDAGILTGCKGGRLETYVMKCLGNDWAEKLLSMYEAVCELKLCKEHPWELLCDEASQKGTQRKTEQLLQAVGVPLGECATAFLNAPFFRSLDAVLHMMYLNSLFQSDGTEELCAFLEENNLSVHMMQPDEETTMLNDTLWDWQPIMAEYRSINPEFKLSNSEKVHLFIRSCETVYIEDSAEDEFRNIDTRVYDLYTGDLRWNGCVAECDKGLFWRAVSYAIGKDVDVFAAEKLAAVCYLETQMRFRHTTSMDSPCLWTKGLFSILPEGVAIEYSVSLFRKMVWRVGSLMNSFYDFAPDGYTNKSNFVESCMIDREHVVRIFPNELKVYNHTHWLTLNAWYEIFQLAASYFIIPPSNVVTSTQLYHFTNDAQLVNSALQTFTSCTPKKFHIPFLEHPAEEGLGKDELLSYFSVLHSKLH